MLAPAANNLFRFAFPRTFIPKEVGDKYKPYLDRIPGMLISEPIDFINYSIQSFNLPGIKYDPVSQTDFPGIKRQHRTSLPLQELYAKEMTVTFQMFEGFLTYWILFETFNWYYELSGKNPYLPEGTRLQVLDEEGNIVVTVDFERVLMVGMSDLEFNYSSNTAEFKTFDVDFVYNKLNTKIELQ